MTYASNNYYKKGSWNVICDVCGKRYKADEVRKRWDDLIVCREDWEADHPQKFLRVQADGKQVPFIRTEPEDTFVDVFYRDSFRDFGGPEGIYVMNTTDRNNNKLDKLYISGHTIRVRWNKIQTGPATFDWALIDDVFASAQSRRQKVTLEIFARDLPAFVASNLSEDPWADHRGFISCVAWDTNAQLAWREFVEILADHLTPLSTGGTVRLADHPALETIDAPLVGMQSVRDLFGTSVTRPDYTREKFIDACIEAVAVMNDYFPDKYKFVGVFPMEDSIETPRLDLAVVSALLDEFIPDGTVAPKLGFFQELLTDAGPETSFIGSPLLLAREKTWVMFQALTTWVTPWTGGDKLASRDCTTGMAYAHNSYGCNYVEIYYKDASEVANADDLNTWAGILTDGTHPLSPTTAPTVVITEPDAREIISGTFNILALATPSGTRTITQVEFYANGTWIRTDTTFPYAYSWNTALVADGEYSIEVRAYDSEGEQGSAYVTCAVENGPAKPYIDIREPDFDIEVTGIVNMVAWVDAINLVDTVEFLIDGVVKKTYNPGGVSGDNYTYSWDTRELALGEYTVTVRAEDTLSAVHTVDFTLYVYDPFS